MLCGVLCCVCLFFYVCGVSLLGLVCVAQGCAFDVSCVKFLWGGHAFFGMGCCCPLGF